MLSFILISAAGTGISYAQCPMCKTALTKARDGGETKVGNTLNSGIMYMLVFPYLIAGVFGFIYYRNYKQKKAAENR